MNPQYTDEYLAAFYADYIAPASPFDPAVLAIGVRRRHEILEQIEAQIGTGRLLCIGCGDGVELAVAHERGWKAEGYDVDRATTERVAQTLGVRIHSGPLTQLALSPESFDCVYLDQVIEHPKDPMACLCVADRLLRTGGVLLVACPNIMSVASMAKTWLGKLGLKRRRGKHYDTQHHLFYYSPRVLGRILESRLGHRIVRCEGDPLIWRRDYPGSLRRWFCRRWAWLDSSFLVLSRKPLVRGMVGRSEALEPSHAGPEAHALWEAAV